MDNDITITAQLTDGTPVVLAWDPNGDHFLVEHFRLDGGIDVQAHRLGPGDTLAAECSRFRRVDGQQTMFPDDPTGSTADIPTLSVTGC